MDTLEEDCAKCANRYVISRRSAELQPIQLGVGVAGGAEATNHATCRYLKLMPDNHILVKLDFCNAFNSIRRDLVLDSIADKMAQLCFVYASCSSNPILTFASQVIRSKEEFQQGNPLSSLGFCGAIHSTLTIFNSNLRIGFMDDFSLSGELSVVTEDVETLVRSAEETGLFLNASKCEIIVNNFDIINNIDTFKDFIKIAPHDMILLGAPVLKGPTFDTSLQNKVGELKRAFNRLKLLCSLIHWSYYEILLTYPHCYTLYVHNRAQTTGFCLSLMRH